MLSFFRCGAGARGARPSTDGCYSRGSAGRQAVAHDEVEVQHELHVDEQDDDEDDDEHEEPNAISE